jgi:GAF domain-containing protein
VLERALTELTHRALVSDDPALFSLVEIARKASADLADRARELRLVAATTAAIATAPDLETALQALLEGLAALTGSEAGSVRLPLGDVGVGPCRVFRWRGGDEYGWHDADTVAGSVSAHVLASRRGSYVADNVALAADGDAGAAVAVEQFGVRSTLIVPLHVAGQTIGTLHANSQRPGAFAAELLVPMQVLADHAAGAVEQARLRAAAEASARLDGAMKTARMVGHELNNKLAIVSGYGDLLVDRLGASDHAPAIRRMVEASDEAAMVLRRLQRIIRFEERTLGGISFLDLEAATAQAHAS